MLAVQEIKAVLNEVQRAVVTFLLNLLAPPNNVDVLQVTKKGAMYLSFNVQVLVSGAQQRPCGMTDLKHAVPAYGCRSTSFLTAPRSCCHTGCRAGHILRDAVCGDSASTHWLAARAGGAAVGPRRGGTDSRDAGSHQ